MEAVQVNLTSYRLPLLMPALCEGSHTTGTLLMERGKVRREFCFRDGLLISQSSTVPDEHLSQVISDLKILEPTRAAEAYLAAEACGVPLGTYLVNSGLVEEPRLIDALEHKAREALFDCYAWDSGDLWFQPDLVRARGIDLKMKLMTLHRDAMARLREWKAFRDVLKSPDLTFRVERQHLRFGGTPEERAILDAAEAGGTLQDLLGVVREVPLFGARRVLQLYQRGALIPWQQASELSATIEVDAELARARELLRKGDCEKAAEIALYVVALTPAAEAHEVYREAEAHLAKQLVERVSKLEGRLKFRPIPRPPPPQLTSDDLYLYCKLRSEPGVLDALRRSAMGELNASRSLFRLMSSGAIVADS